MWVSRQFAKYTHCGMVVGWLACEENLATAAAVVAGQFVS